MSAKFAIHHEPFFLCRFSEQAVFIGWIQARVEINRRKEDLKQIGAIKLGYSSEVEGQNDRLMKLHAKRTNDAIEEE